MVAKLAEILKDQRPTRNVAAMFIDMAFGSPNYERLRALGFNNVFETNFGLIHTPDRTKANMRAYMWDKMKDWLLHGAIETDEKMAMDLAGPGYHINRSNLLVLESKADMQKRGQASPDDGDALALTFALPVAPAEVEEPDEEEEFGSYCGRFRGKERPGEALAGATQRSDSDPYDTTSKPIAIGPHWMIMWTSCRPPGARGNWCLLTGGGTGNLG
jgi:hypothetical protein